MVVCEMIVSVICVAAFKMLMIIRFAYIFLFVVLIKFDVMFNVVVGMSRCRFPVADRIVAFQFVFGVIVRMIVRLITIHWRWLR